ncbi:MAG: hypothetical protein ACM3UR_10415 [Bacteroidota bacterium]|jgi:hypothetical protein|nr:hypothetical protein [Ignavibacteria bacterium]MCU7499684.1 hypothetical protein [Ignavibacteria bacterium]MCU7511988.1 hypothetical protein [Ignavibacteria bacterium]MCU7521312.1 hypothetical protein [Ignavibacteria bacterium]MCU7524761.1 hypothetical protein [Ignavibacteria bacterium]
MKRAMMTIDFDGSATFEQSRSFSNELLRRDWQKLDKLNTVWQTIFEEGLSGENIFDVIKSDINFALDKAGIKKIKAEIYLGSSKFILA